MVTMRPHQAKDYADFPDIDAPGIGILDDDDRACLNELGDCLVRSKTHRRFGASLLHSHFPVEDGETLVESVDFDAGLLSLRPRQLKFSFAATNMRFEGEESHRDGIRLVGLEFASKRELCGVGPIGGSDTPVLTRLRQILARHGKLHRFGIRLLHDPLKLNGGYCWRPAMP